MSIEQLNEKNIFWQEAEVNKDDRCRMKGHKSAIIWFTGLSGSGKTSLSRLLEKRLHELGIHTYILDGDNMRHGLNRDLGFSKDDRRENIRRIGEVAKLFVDAGVLVICAFVSPYRSDRRMVRDLVGEHEFIKVYVKCPVGVCMSRDPKGLYKKAIAGEIKCFTGIDDPYEEPENPEVTIETDKTTVSEGVDRIIEYLKKHHIVV